MILLKTFVVFNGNIYANINTSQHKGVQSIKIKIYDGVNAASCSGRS